jgi:hypothetical protein
VQVYAADVLLGITSPASSSSYILKVGRAGVLFNMERNMDTHTECAKWTAGNSKPCADPEVHLSCSESCAVHGNEFASVIAFSGSQTFRVLQLSDNERSCLIPTTQSVDDVFYFRLLLKTFIRGTLVSSRYVFGGLRVNESRSALWEEFGGLGVRLLAHDTSADCTMTLTPSMSGSSNEPSELCPVEFEYSARSHLTFAWGTLAPDATPFVMLSVRDAAAPQRTLSMTVPVTVPLLQWDPSIHSLSHASRCQVVLMRLFLAVLLHQSG